jgi:hypothetical protein
MLFLVAVGANGMMSNSRDLSLVTDPLQHIPSNFQNFKEKMFEKMSMLKKKKRQ